MQIDSAESLIETLRTSGLFGRDRLEHVEKDLSGFSGGFQDLLKHVVSRNFLTIYQVRKIIHGKAAELLIGPYVVTDKIGGGGMGRVYRAVQTHLKREVAIKIVRSNLLGNQIVRKRYEREVETASALDHPNVVRVTDAGEVDGKYYLAMEFVDGIDLSRLVRMYRPLEIAEACEYARQAALGLQYAHEQGLVHRDIKPSNIIVAGERHVPQATEPCTVKILDMGLVRNVGFDDGGGGGDLTRAGTVVGTPDYMSPEQARNSSAVDHRADLYSLGCTLYYMISGQPPFSASTAIEKLLKHQLEAPIPLQALRPDVPAPVAEIIARLLAKQPDQRFQSAAEVADRLAPLSEYPLGQRQTAPTLGHSTNVSTHTRVQPPPGEEAYALSAVAGSTLGQEQANSDTAPRSQPVAPGVQTPHPRVSGTGLPPAVEEEGSPFDVMSEPISGSYSAVTPPKQNSSLKAPPQRTNLWIVAALGAIVLVGVAVGLILSTGKKKPESPGESSATPTEGTTRSGSRSGSSPTKLVPWTDLVVSNPCFVAVASPSGYLRNRETPYNVGGGPGRLVRGVETINAKNGLSVDRAERLVFSIPSGRTNQFLVVSEGENLRPPSGPQPAGDRDPTKSPSSAKEPKKTTNRPSAVIPHPSGSRIYAVASSLPLLDTLRNRVASDATASTSPIDRNLQAALNAVKDQPPPLVVAAAGPKFVLPLMSHSWEEEDLTLENFGLESISGLVRLKEKIEIEVSLTGGDESRVRAFLAWFQQRLGDDYPRDGGPFLGLMKRAEERVSVVDGKSRLTLKATCTPEQWSALLEKLF